jgi:hypothetical protein
MASTVFTDPGEYDLSSTAGLAANLASMALLIATFGGLGIWWGLPP